LKENIEKGAMQRIASFKHTHFGSVKSKPATIIKMIKKLCIFILAISLVGCSKSDRSNMENENQHALNDVISTSHKGSIIITGSTSVEKILNGMIEEFTAIYPNITIDYVGSGSSAGITDTKSGINNIGTASRAIKSTEEDGYLKSVVFAYDGIAVIVNPENESVNSITTEQLVDIYTGRITNWQEVGGENTPIFVISREESSGTRTAFEEIVDLSESGGLTNHAAISEGNGTVQAGVAGNPNAIGYVSFSYINESVKTLTVNGIEPSVNKTKSGEYPLARPYVFCYYDEYVTDVGAAFLEFALSEDGQEIVYDYGGIQVK